MYNPFMDVANRVLPEPQASLLNGILFGIRANFPRDFYEGLITTGTVHIIALSGQNIAILTRIIAGMTLIFGRKLSSLTTIASIFGFVLFVGAEPTIIRAAIMGSLSLIAVYFGRQDWSLLSLILAAGIMLLINPDWLGNVSFQLSFLATLGIILFGPKAQPPVRSFLHEMRRDLKINFLTTLSAQVFTVPLIFFHFRRISLIAPLTNVLIAPTIGPLMGLGLLVGLSGWFYLPIGQVLGLIVWVPLTFIVQVVEVTKTFPYASVAF